MVNLILLVIFLLSVIGIGVILARKIPVLAQLSIEAGEEQSILQKMKIGVQQNGTLNAFSPEILLQKVLSKIRVLTLRTEHKTGTMLQQLRQKSLEKKKKLADDYWQKIRRKK